MIFYHLIYSYFSLVNKILVYIFAIHIVIIHDEKIVKLITCDFQLILDFKYY